MVGNHRSNLIRGNITIKGHEATQVAFKNCAPFTKYIRKINGTTIDDAEDLDLVMLMHNLIEYSSNNSETTEYLWFYSKNKATDINADIADSNNFKSFMYKAKLLENTRAKWSKWNSKKYTICCTIKIFKSFLGITLNAII